MDRDVPEFDLIGNDALDAAADRDETLPAEPAWRWRRDVPVAVAFVFLGLLAGRVFQSNTDSSDSQRAQDTTSTSQPVAVPTQPAPPTREPVASPTPEATTNPTTTTNTAEVDPAVRLLAGSSALQGAVVLAPFAPFGEAETVWVIEPDRLIMRPNVPLRPGDWPNYILFTGSHIAFTSPPDAFVLPADLSAPAIPVTPARYLVPGVTPDLVWAINDAITTATPIDMTTGQPGQEILLGDDVGWVSAEIAHGFVVSPKDHDTYGSYAFLAPNEPLEPIVLPQRSQSGIGSTAGNMAIVVSPGPLISGPLISALDITTGELTGVLVDLDQGLVADVCISPDQRYAIVVGSTGRAAVIDFEQEEVATEIPLTQKFQAVGWTSDTQLVYIFEEVLLSYDVVTGARDPIAQVDRAVRWTVSGSAAMC